MYKVYINIASKNSNNIYEEQAMQKLLKEVETNLLKEDKYIVYNGVDKTTDEAIDESNKIGSDLHLVLQNTTGSSKGPVVFIKTGDDMSNGFGKEIYKEIMKIYNDKSVDNAIDFDTKISEIEKSPKSGVATLLYSVDNKKDSQWFMNNINLIALAITNGIIKGFALRPC